MSTLETHREFELHPGARRLNTFRCRKVIFNCKNDCVILFVGYRIAVLEEVKTGL